MAKKNKKPKAKPRTKPVEPTSGYEWIKATVAEDKKSVSLRYRVTDFDRDGSDGLEDDVSEWKDVEIQEQCCAILGLEKKFAQEVQLDWD